MPEMITRFSYFGDTCGMHTYMFVVYPKKCHTETALVLGACMLTSTMYAISIKE